MVAEIWASVMPSFVDQLVALTLFLTLIDFIVNTPESI